MTVLGVLQRESGPATAMLGVITRIEEILEAEAKILRSLQDHEISAMNDRKSRALLEFSRTVRALPPGSVDDHLRLRIVALRGLLEENRILVALHLKAARDIAAIVSSAIEENESDGTYSSRIITGRASP